jgi:hypothetical protein
MQQHNPTEILQRHYRSHSNSPDSMTIHWHFNRVLCPFVRRATQSLAVAAAHIGAHAQPSTGVTQGLTSWPGHACRDQQSTKEYQIIHWPTPCPALVVTQTPSLHGSALPPHFRRSVTSLSESRFRSFQSMLNSANAVTKARFLGFSAPWLERGACTAHCTTIAQQSKNANLPPEDQKRNCPYHGLYGVTHFRVRAH